jgi:hypothetical protein
MIHVDRNRIPEPAILRTPEVRSAQEKAEAFFARRKQARVQERFDFPSLAALKELRPALLELFYAKCAYCESPVLASFGDIELFRPRTAASELISRGVSPSQKSSKGWLALVTPNEDRDGYWWLAYEWENIYFACAICSRHKRNQFPVIGQRARPGTRGEALREELALLLDPCVDQPEDYLIFGDHGEVVGRKTSDEDELRQFRGWIAGPLPSMYWV